MSAILDLDQIACSGNEVVSDKCVFAFLDTPAGVFVAEDRSSHSAGGGESFDILHQDRVAATGSDEGLKCWGGVFCGSLVTTFIRPLRR